MYLQYSVIAKGVPMLFSYSVDVPMNRTGALPKRRCTVEELSSRGPVQTKERSCGGPMRMEEKSFGGPVQTLEPSF